MIGRVMIQTMVHQQLTMNRTCILLFWKISQKTLVSDFANNEQNFIKMIFILYLLHSSLMKIEQQK